MVAGGLRAVLTCVDPKQLAADFAGRHFDSELLAALPPSVDPCGERGEFHTFAYDGPMFARPVPVRVGERLERDGFVFADLLAPDRVRIRDYAAESDAPALRACYIELQEFERALEPDLPPGEETADAYLALLFDRCARYRGRIFVAEREGRVIGFSGVQAAMPPDEPDEPQEPYAFVSDLVVLPEARREGTGRALLARAEQFARGEGARVLLLGVLARNAGARALYRDEGFRERFLFLEKTLRPAGRRDT
jgi:GNAT superfamily N-acetyltransferase